MVMRVPRWWPREFPIGVLVAALLRSTEGREVNFVKMSEEIMRILEAFNLTESYRAAAELVGCDHHTVKKYVQKRDAGKPVLERPQRVRAIDGFLEKVEEWVERSEGKIRADRSHEKLVAMGYHGSERTYPQSRVAREEGVPAGQAAGGAALASRAGLVASVRLG